MELTVTLDYGALNAEFTGSDREEVEDNLLGFVEFLEENAEVFDGVDLSAPEESIEDPGLDPEYWEGQQETSESETTPEAELVDQEITYGNIPSRTGIDREVLARYFDIDPEAEEPPYLNFDVENLGESGDSRSEKQMRGSLILLTLWRECNDVEEVRSPALKDALRISGVNDTNLSNMYQFNSGEGDRYFRREGTGENTDISLTMPGEREGYDQIRRTVERLEGEVEE